MASPLLSEIIFGAFVAYSPRGTETASVNSRRVRDGIKSGSETMLDRAMTRLTAEFEASGLEAVLGPDVTLVPAPRSSVLLAGGLWPADLLCKALVEAGFGREVLPCLSRTEAVPKSAFAKQGERPSADRHYETMVVESSLALSPRMTVVDDFVTKGNTLLAGASRVKEAFAEADVRAFALLRTLGFQPEIERVVEPCIGRIRRGYGGDAQREP